MPQGAVLPAGTELRSLLGTEDQTNCEFRTAHEVQMLPIEIADAEYIASPGAVAALGLPEQRGVRAAIRMRLRTTGEAPFNKLALDRLVLFPRRRRRARGCGCTSSCWPTWRQSTCVRPSGRCRGRSGCRTVRSARWVSIRMRRCCRACRSRSTATGCCRNTTRCRSGSCSSSLAGWIARWSAAPARSWRSCCC